MKRAGAAPKAVRNRGVRKKTIDTRTVGITALVADGDERAFREFLSDLFAAATTMQTLRRLCARPFGLSSTELAVMMAVSSFAASPSVRGIADHLQISASNVTADIGKLVKARLLAKQPDPDDARAIKVALTEKGIRLVQDMAPVLRAVNDRLFADLSKNDMALLTRLLRQIIVEGGRIVDDDGRAES